MSDIYTIEKRIDDIIKFLEERLESTTTLYVPTRNRFESWIEKFNKAIKLTTRIIQEDELQDDEEFENNPSVSVEQIFNNLYQLADRYEELLGKTKSSTTKSTKSTNTLPLSTEDKKEIVCQYRDCINYLVEKVDTSKIGYLRECAYIIKQWFDARYKIGETDFKYDVRTLPVWITGIVITYSRNISTNSTQKFVLDFSEWIDNVDANPLYSTYPVPYNIYMNTKNVFVDDTSITAMVLWDLLFDNGFYRLLSTKVPISQTAVHDMFKSSKNISDISNVGSYKYYKDDESVLYTSGLLTEGDNND